MEKKNNISNHKGFLFRLSDPRGHGREEEENIWGDQRAPSLLSLVFCNLIALPTPIQWKLLLQIGCKQIRRAEARRIQECREKDTAIACLLGLRICFFLVQRTVTQKRERLIELLGSFCTNYWKTVGGGGGACVTQKRKKEKKERKVIEEKMISGQPKSFLPRPLGIFITFRV
jgi:hypothetical protein